jgi:hypothetical protein
MSTTLYIIGNGFDLHHGIPSKYEDFGRFLKSRDPKIYGFVEEYFGIDDEFWSDFETRLATFDAYALMEHASDLLTPYGADDWKDSSHHDYPHEIGRVVEALSGGLKCQFASWIRQLKIPDPTTIASKLLRIDASATFLNFNYTSSLTTLYGLSQSSVYHLHGSAADADNDLILGHGWNPADRSSSADRHDSEETDTRVIDGNQAIDQYFKQTFKPTDRVIAAHQPFFEGLRDIQRILVMGHRLADVDLPYFKEIARHVDGRNVRWRISYYHDDDLPDLRRQLGNLDCVPEDLVEFKRLVDF